jgi:hypothetical protein
MVSVGAGPVTQLTASLVYIIFIYLLGLGFDVIDYIEEQIQ